MVPSSRSRAPQRPSLVGDGKPALFPHGYGLRYRR
jgi:hypothetical protein